MSDKIKGTAIEQLSIADLLNMSNDAENILSSKELETAIGKLQECQAQAKRRENSEQQKREREQRERKARKDQEKKDAHIREVTCMDLSIDRDNAFNFDLRTQGVHVESVPDALVLSLTNLGKVDIEYISSATGISYKEVIGILRGWLGFFDAAIIEPKPFSCLEEFIVIKPAGGGGTDFQIIFEYVDQHMQENPPVSIIILTDGYAPFPKEELTNGIPVLWLINNEEIDPPWGKVARIKV